MSQRFAYLFPPKLFPFLSTTLRPARARLGRFGLHYDLHDWCAMKPQLRRTMSLTLLGYLFLKLDIPKHLLNENTYLFFFFFLFCPFFVLVANRFYWVLFGTRHRSARFPDVCLAHADPRDRRLVLSYRAQNGSHWKKNFVFFKAYWITELIPLTEHHSSAAVAALLVRCNAGESMLNWKLFSA